MRFIGKTVLITGGANGIGLATGRRFAAEGANVVLADLLVERAQDAADQIEAAGGTAIALHADAGNAAHIQMIVDTAVERFGGIDIVVACAGRGSSNVDFFELDIDEWDAVLQLNLTGPFLLGKAVARHMLATGRKGAIVHISSVGAMLGVPTQAPYCVSKAGLAMLTKTMALSLAPHGIRVNAIGPGPINTAMTGPILDDEALSRMILSRTPLGRVGEPDEVATIALFLASEEASYVTGQTIYADGGRLALNYVMPPAGQPAPARLG
jgi:NAD(P)-dependent dehydrogenase (short-subunit alcohol dehydrogenase family)